MTREEGHDVALGDFIHQRDEFVAHSIAPVRRVVVGHVMNRSNVFFVDEVVKRLTAKGSQRLRGIVHHRRKSIDAGAAQHIQEHCLGEVIHRVSGHRPGR